MLRQAVKIKLPKTHFADSILYENYQRLDPHPGYGFNFTADKKLSRKVSILGGFAKISHPMFNGDRFPQGKRVYAGAAYKISRELSLNSVLIQAVGPLVSSTGPRTRFDLILSYDILPALRRYKVF